MNTEMLRCVISTLNDIEVKGRENLDKLLGSIMALERIAQDMECPSPAEASKEVADG